MRHPWTLRRPCAAALVLGALTLVACAGGGPEGGKPPPPACKPPSPPTISFASNVQPIYNRSCALGGCHDAATRAQGLNLSPGAAYRATVAVKSTEQRSLDLIEKGEPDDSYLVRKIENTPGITPTIMPQGCSDPGQGGTGTNGAPCLSLDEVAAIRTWVTECAPNN